MVISVWASRRHSKCLNQRLRCSLTTLLCNAYGHGRNVLPLMPQMQEQLSEHFAKRAEGEKIKTLLYALLSALLLFTAAIVPNIEKAI